MLMYQNERVGCTACIRGHRASHCLHYNKQLISIKSQGKTADKTESLRLVFKPNPEITYEDERPVEKNNGRAKGSSMRKCIHLDPNTKYEIWRVKSGKGFALVAPASPSDVLQNTFRIKMNQRSIAPQASKGQICYSYAYGANSFISTSKKQVDRYRERTSIKSPHKTGYMYGETTAQSANIGTNVFESSLQAFQYPQLTKNEAAQASEDVIGLDLLEAYESGLDYNEQLLSNGHNNASSVDHVILGNDLQSYNQNSLFSFNPENSGYGSLLINSFAPLGITAPVYSSKSMRPATPTAATPTAAAAQDTIQQQTRIGQTQPAVRNQEILHHEDDFGQFY